MTRLTVLRLVKTVLIVVVRCVDIDHMATSLQVESGSTMSLSDGAV